MSSGDTQEELDHDERECQGRSCRRDRNGESGGSVGRNTGGRRRRDGQDYETGSYGDKRRGMPRGVNAGRKWRNG